MKVYPILKSKFHFLSVVLCIVLFSTAFIKAQTATNGVTSLTYIGGYHIKCNGQSTGTLNANPSFGVYPYTYLWSSGETTREINNKPAGIYIVTMTDSLNNTDVDTFELRQPDALSYSPDITDYNGFNVRSNGGDDGQVTLFPSGGTPPYKWVWSDGYQQHKRNNMSAGTYSFTISDANQCSTTGSVNLIAPSPLQYSFSNIQNPTCYGSEDGSVQLNISGGIGDYTVSWDNGSFELNPTDLIDGYNEVRIYDKGRLVIDTGIVLTEPPPVTANVVLSDYNGFNVSCVDCFNGTINANVTGGTAPYVFDWKDDPNITGPNRSNLNGGFYPVTISDANGCQPKRETIIALTMPNPKDWSRQGNANIDPNDFIGSTDASDVLFKTNNQEALRLMGNGNIGVGTSSPTEKLEVNGTIKAQGLKLNNLNFRYESASGLIPEKITWGSEDNAPWGTAGTPVLPYNCLDQVLVNRFNLFKGAAVFKAPASTSGCNNNESTFFVGLLGCDGVIETVEDGSSYTGGQTSNFNKLLLNTFCGRDVVVGRADGGNLIVNHNLGIGVAAPNERLEVAGNGIINGRLSVGGAGNNGYFAPSTDYQLCVNGKIVATEILVKERDNWPDYVFKKDYKLKSIKEVNNYIKKHGHLPGAPTANEVQNNGINTGEMLNLQMQKIEELTLYIIDLQKQIDALKQDKKKKI